MHAHANQRNNITEEKLHSLLNNDAHCLFSINEMGFVCVLYVRAIGNDFAVLLISTTCVCAHTHIGGFAQSVFNYPNHIVNVFIYISIQAILLACIRD